MDSYGGAIPSAGLPAYFLDGYCVGAEANAAEPKNIGTAQALLESATAVNGVTTIVFRRPLVVDSNECRLCT